MRRRLVPSLLVLTLVATTETSGCTTGLECTEAGCEHEAIVTYPPGLVSGPYDLVLQGDTETLMARCNDPSAPEAEQNPPELTCDSNGFTLIGGPLANERSVRLTLIDVQSEEARVADIEVFLDAVDEVYPNGPDCPPVCYIRNGQVLLPGP